MELELVLTPNPETTTMNTQPLNLSKYDLFQPGLSEDELKDYVEDLEQEALWPTTHAYSELYEELFDPDLEDLLADVGC